MLFLPLSLIIVCLKTTLCIASHQASPDQLDDDDWFVTDQKHHDVTSKNNKLVLLSPFDYYNGVCKSQCSGESLGEKFSINPCPMCGDKYSHENCNHCCKGGASSLKLRWYGCSGVFSILEKMTQTEFQAKCTSSNFYKAVLNDSTLNNHVAFVNCSCYDSILKYGGGPSNGCAITEGEVHVKNSNAQPYVDICIVSLDPDTKVIDLTRSLPNPILLQQNLTHTNKNWNRFSMLTMFDTSCEADTNGSKKFPVPGYGKFANTCPDKGYIQLKNSSLSIPKEIEFYSGTPPAEMFWFEYVDGTSTSFFQSKSLHQGKRFFDPSFATCSCSECPSELPSLSPTSQPSQTPSVQPQQTEVPNINVSQQEREDCSYEKCNLFATKNCITKTTKKSCHYDAKIHSRQRQLNALKDVIQSLEIMETNYNATKNETLMLNGNAVTRQWILKQIQYHFITISYLKDNNINNGL